MLTPYPLEPPPRLPPLDEPWEEADAPLLSGRRVRVRADGAIDLAGIATLERIGPVGPGERRCVALEEPCFLWDRGGTPACWAIHLAGSDLHVERSDDGSSLWLTRERDPSELLIACRGGRLDLTESGTLRLSAEGDDRLRLIFVAADDEGDRERTIRALVRKGSVGLRTQRRQHFDRVLGVSTELRTPDQARNEAFRALAPEFDSHLVELAGGRRTFPDLKLDGATLLSLGVREPVRDVLRAPFDTAASLSLLAAYGQWAGDDEFLRKQWPRAAAALRDSDRSPDARRAAAALVPLAEAVGDHATLGVVEGILAGGPDIGEPATPLPAELGRLWGVVPGALDRVVTLAPALPADWREMTLTRLRIGGTTFDTKVARRPSGLSVKLRVTHGPALLVHLAPVLSFVPTGVLVGAEQIPGPTVRFEVDAEAEATWVAL